MNQLLTKIPKPVLVFLVLVLALVVFVYNDPLKDECEVQAKMFDQNTKGLLSSMKKNKKIQFAQLSPLRDRCKEGNSVGVCSEYFEALRKIATELKVFKNKCQLKYAEENENFVIQIGRAIQIISLVAWGEKPPLSVSDRLGWLNEAQVKTFCTLKKTYLLLAGEERFGGLRNQIFLEYPGLWITESGSLDKAEIERRLPENRPKALKTAANPNGQFDVNQIYERSLFSIRCDLYL